MCPELFGVSVIIFGIVCFGIFVSFSVELSNTLFKAFCKFISLLPSKVGTSATFGFASISSIVGTLFKSKNVFSLTLGSASVFGASGAIFTGSNGFISGSTNTGVGTIGGSGVGANVEAFTKSLKLFRLFINSIASLITSFFAVATYVFLTFMDWVFYIFISSGTTITLSNPIFILSGFIANSIFLLL